MDADQAAREAAAMSTEQLAISVGRIAVGEVRIFRQAVIQEAALRLAGPPPATVECLENCEALREPQTMAELRAALEHWQHHSSPEGGCSHDR
jgi:hypothetical protein